MPFLPTTPYLRVVGRPHCWKGRTLWSIFEALIWNVTPPRPPGSLSPDSSPSPSLPLRWAWASFAAVPFLFPQLQSRVTDKFARAPFTTPLPEPFHCFLMIWLESS